MTYHLCMLTSSCEPVEKESRARQQKTTVKASGNGHHHRGGEREKGLRHRFLAFLKFWDTFIYIFRTWFLCSNSTKIQKLYLARNNIKRYNKSTRWLQPSGA